GASPPPESSCLAGTLLAKKPWFFSLRAPAQSVPATPPRDTGPFGPPPASRLPPPPQPEKKPIRPPCLPEYANSCSLSQPVPFCASLLRPAPVPTCVIL